MSLARHHLLSSDQSLEGGVGAHSDGAHQQTARGATYYPEDGLFLYLLWNKDNAV